MDFDEMNFFQKIKHYYLITKWGGRKNRALVQSIYDQEKFLSKNHRRLLCINGRKASFPKKLMGHIKNFKKKNLKILEIGSGPLSYLAWGVESKLFDLISTDPLAEEYNNFVKKRGISYPVKPIKCFGESLIKKFGKDSFDIVYSRNSLDHTKNPLVCMDNIFGVLKPRGLIYITFIPNVGTKEKWTGLHQHDLFLSKNFLFCKNKFGESVNLTKNPNLRIISKSFTKREPNWCTVVYQKSAQSAAPK